MKERPTGRHIAFIGIGNLGESMVLNLLERGWDVTVLDRAVDRVGGVTAAGATAAKELTDLKDHDIICLAVPDDEAVTKILLGSSGLMHQLQPHQSVIVHSTILPATARSLGEQFNAAGLNFLDAPVSGGAARARSGELTLMVGATAEALAAVKELLNDVAADVIHVGPPGAGAATKLANQLMMFSALAGAHEALALATAYGVDEPHVLEALSTSTGDTWVGRNWGFFDGVAAEYNRLGTPLRDRPWSKDLNEVVTAARSAEIDVPFAALLAQTLPRLVEQHASLSKSMQETKGDTNE
ncbi:NAD(P)-dependent oxidoreductase [Pseudarthrobacter sp. NamE2]|uniref:NAD(P)-dependent oxidoreductase n=1 Tax=Pseudarthrobacter sp. NamE2 TaxID=2576838 RepID=UPI0010FDDA0D|nr:NAD(P)-dependent oxidoreductase [Pseudarthrobacter sp. NamE2]TLM80988.1 NAD(P)-dependent oxidoreductase [Pseudarthrobacter sp. NamE2]